ncbi:CHAT domain protein [Candidatus Venteria ishoeyi]|uniref:CHAT domain protein n=1 Tax=Candidatus Venteria ishoeyi TaxID=1899563 RepID=A0A1H6FGM8_9GAMM|nr:CHAT domain protein [Candidatus Venteria ishoeyi]
MLILRKLLSDITYIVGLLALVCSILVQADELETLQQQGEYQKLVSLLQQAVKKTGAAEHHLSLAQTYHALGHYQRAIQQLEALKPEGLNAVEQTRYWLVYNKIAMSQARLQFDVLFDVNAKALAAASLLKNHKVRNHKAQHHQWLAKVWNQHGHIQSIALNYPEALLAYDKALELVPAIDLLHAKIQLNRLVVLLEQQPSVSPVELNTVWQQTWSSLEKQASSYTQVLALIRLAQQGERLPKPEHHRLLTVWKQAYQQALELNNNNAKAYAAGGFGGYLAARGDLDNALKLTRQALFYAQYQPENARIYRWYHQLGRLSAKQQNSSEAISAYQAAIKILEKHWRNESYQGYRDHYQRFEQNVQPVYAEFFQLLANQIQSQKQQDQALLQTLLQVIEAFNQVELENYFKSPCKLNADNRGSACSRLSAPLPAKQAVLYPLLLEKELLLLLKIGDRLTLRSIPVSAGQLSYQVTDFVSQLRRPPAYTRGLTKKNKNGGVESCQVLTSRSRYLSMQTSAADDQKAYLKSAQILYQWLISPIESALQTAQIDTLIVIPNKILYTLPFAALHDGEKYLIQNLSLAIAPGQCLILSPNPNLQQEQQAILLAGLSESVQAYPALPCVQHELSKIQNLYQNQSVDLLFNQSFVLPLMKTNLSQRTYRNLHIASHGEFNGDVEQSFILTYDQKINFNTLESLLRLQTNSAALDLLVLSACETAAGNDKAALGLAGIAIKAGVSSVLASLWRIDDQLTSVLVANFYQQWQQALQENSFAAGNLGKAHALSSAQRLLLEDESYIAYRHPYYWAAFLLIGNP